MLDQPGLVDAVLLPGAAIGVGHREDRLVLSPPPGQPVVADRHAFVAGTQFVAALLGIAAVQRPELAPLALLAPAAPGCRTIRRERPRSRSRRGRTRPLPKPIARRGLLQWTVVAFGHETVVAPAVEPDEAHIPPPRLARALGRRKARPCCGTPRARGSSGWRESPGPASNASRDRRGPAVHGFAVDRRLFAVRSVWATSVSRTTVHRYRLILRPRQLPRNDRNLGSTCSLALREAGLNGSSNDQNRP